MYKQRRAQQVEAQVSNESDKNLRLHDELGQRVIEILKSETLLKQHNLDAIRDSKLEALLRMPAVQSVLTARDFVALRQLAPNRLRL